MLHTTLWYDGTKCATQASSSAYPEAEVVVADVSAAHYSEESAASTPASTVPSVATTVATIPAVDTTAKGHVPFDPSCAIEDPILIAAIDFYVAAVANGCCLRRAPVSASLRASVADVLSRLVLDGWCSTGQLVSALCLVRRLATSDTVQPFPSFKPKRIIISTANARRVLVSTLRLVAMVTDDTHYTFASMCRAAGLSSSTDSLQMMAQCEWSVGAALGFDCIVPTAEFNDMMDTLLSVP